MADKTLEDAIKLACDAHRGQTDKGGVAYILHPLRVMASLTDAEYQIAAVLHDVVEDAGIELSLIRHWFGDDVADAVDALSRREGESYGAFIERCAENEIARDVKWFDLCDNEDLSRIPSPTNADLKRVEKYQNAKQALMMATLHAQAIDTPPRLHA